MRSFRFPDADHGALRARSSGFTLSELLVAMAVAGIIVTIVYQVFVTQQRVYTLQDDVAEAQQNARVAVDELTRSISPLGVGADVANGQRRILLAHENELVFNADLSPDADLRALPQGTALGLASVTANDPYAVVPGTYSNASPPVAESHRYYLNSTGTHASLYHQIGSTNTATSVVGWGTSMEIAMLLANLRVGTPLFRYYGDFDGDGTFETLARVDQATSPLVAAGVALDSVIQRVDLEVITETPHPDPRHAPNSGYRQTVLNTSITPRNVWDCPLLRPVPMPPGPYRAPNLFGTTTPVQFQVTRGGSAEQGRTVTYQISGPPGFAAQSGQTTSDATGLATAPVIWPPPPAPGAPCTALPQGTYTVTAATTTPPTLDTPFGACSPHTATTQFQVVAGTIAEVRFLTDPVTLDTCGDTATLGYELLDACRRPVANQDVGANQVWFTEPLLGGSVTPASAPGGLWSGNVTYQSSSNAFPLGSTRSGTAPHPFTTTLEGRDGNPSGTLLGQTSVELEPQPDAITGLTANLSGLGTSFSDCPSSTGVNSEVFNIIDDCGNPVWTLDGTPQTVQARLDSAYPGSVGGLTSTNNQSTPATPIQLRENNGTPGQFDVFYAPPTCGLGGSPRHVDLVLTPSWNPSAPAGPVAFDVQPCTSCAVQILDAQGSPTTSLNRECAPSYDVVVTHCETIGPATVELVIVPLSGTPPSFDPTQFVDRTTLSFAATNPPGLAQQATAQLHMGWADTGGRFQIVAYMPDQAYYANNPQPSPAVMCQSPEVTVDSSCEELLISGSPVNRGSFPTPNGPRNTVLCGLDGTPVYFRVKDCDQNLRDTAADDLTNLSVTTNGIRVEVRDWVTKSPIDEERPDALLEVNQDGLSRSDEPYFQGSLLVTQNPLDGPGSGLLKVPEGRVVELRATYQDPNDPGDRNCETFALLVPPLPLCIPMPAVTFGDWVGDGSVFGGDLGVVGGLRLPALPQLILKDQADPLDRFFNAYVGGDIFLNGVAQPGATTLAQPLSTRPNYFSRVPNVAGLLSRLDYDTLRSLAIARQVYWEPGPQSGQLQNPFRVDPQTGQPFTGTFQAITDLGQRGAVTSTHDGEFLFVDLPASLQGQSVDNLPLAQLPVYRVTGNYYTEGLLYVAGSVELDPGNQGELVAVEFAAQRDLRYDEASGTITRSDLPLDFDTATPPVPVGNLAVQVEGLIYADGEVELAANSRVHGAVVGERGVTAAGGSQIWYDPRWAGSRLDLCSECCGLSLAPGAPPLSLGDTLQLTATQAQGLVTWDTSDPGVATVDSTGHVQSVAVGQVVIRATDDAGCVAEIQVDVVCGLSLASSAGVALIPGDITNIATSGARGTVTWSSDNPATLSLNRTLGPSVVATAGVPGGSQVAATDTIILPQGTATCTTTENFVVNCPGGGRLLEFTPANATVGDTVTLRVTEGGQDVSAGYTFFADGGALPSQSFTIPGPAPISFSASLGGGVCPVGPVGHTP